MSMSIEDVAKVLAKVQLGDNREVTKLLILEWHDTIGDLLTLDQAIAAVRRFRRERPGVYLEPGHLLELAEVEVAEYPIRSIDAELMEESRAKALAAAGVTEQEYLDHQHDVVWLRSKFAPRALEADRG